MRHEEYVCEFTHHLAEEEEQRKAEAEFKVSSNRSCFYYATQMLGRPTSCICSGIC
jgi:hypothetical protein